MMILAWLSTVAVPHSALCKAIHTERHKVTCAGSGFFIQPRREGNDRWREDWEPEAEDFWRV